MLDFTLIHGADFTKYVQPLGYMGIYLWFVTIDQVTFIPEEVTLITIGYLSSSDVFNPVLAGLLSVAAFITIDLIYYLLTLSGNKLVKKFTEKLGKTWLSKLSEKFRKNFPKALLIISFIPRMRLFAPVVANMVKIKLPRFLAFDTMGLCLFTAVYISIGYFAHKGLQSIFSEVKTWGNIIFIGAMLLFTVITIIMSRKAKTIKAN